MVPDHEPSSHIVGAVGGARRPMRIMMKIIFFPFPFKALNLSTIQSKRREFLMLKKVTNGETISGFLLFSIHV